MNIEAWATIIITVVINLLIVAVTAGVMKNKIENNEKLLDEQKQEFTDEIKELKADFQKEIDEIKRDAKEQSVILQSINNNITDLNTQFRLFLSGQLKIKGMD